MPRSNAEKRESLKLDVTRALRRFEILTTGDNATTTNSEVYARALANLKLALATLADDYFSSKEVS